ncbi:MAG: response regulator [Planctomycetales bacterium]|nr:response regulator [Planctomycetales bacterium]
MKPSVLFIDDEVPILDAYRRMLRDHRGIWDMHFISCPLEALEFLKREPVSAVVTDVCMPRIGGLELLRQIRGDARLADLPVVVVTGDSDRTLKRQALDLEATDLLAKPVDQEILRVRIRNALRLYFNSQELQRERDLLERRVRERTRELDLSRQEIIWRLAKASEYRDEETGNHVVRVACYSRAVAKALGQSDSFVDQIFLAAPLHDLGKIGIPDAVLLKPGKLDENEWRIMKRHCEMGASILSDSSRLRQAAGVFFGTSDPNVWIPIQTPLMVMATSIALAHHEKWNGTGYPFGKKGDEIPLEARIVAIADVYDALRSRRPYKDPFPEEVALDILEQGAGEHFDPEVVNAFLSCYREIQSVERELSDSAQTLLPETRRDELIIR